MYEEAPTDLDSCLADAATELREAELPSLARAVEQARERLSTRSVEAAQEIAQ